MWKSGNAQTVTFIITEDCNLRCKYCYITHKAPNKKMSLETAKEFIDYLLTSNINTNEYLIIEFLGGEPFIEAELIDKISDYFKIASFEANNEWYWKYRISICTNGVNYSDDIVQHFIRKNMGKLSVTITLDGTKEKHDLQRVFPNGTGSYDIINRNIPLWLSQFRGSTKVTFASDDLKFLKTSIISLWDAGITDVAANVVFEDVWKDGDDIIFENQLKELADYVLENKIFNKYYCTLFDENLGGHYNRENLDSTYCGAGKMIALDSGGNLYPCMRYKAYSLDHNKEWIIGSVNTGIDMEKVRPFVLAMTKLQSDDECIDCEVASGCAFCQGFNYDQAETPTNFSRAKYICKMHKARVRANDYYFSLLFNRYGIQKEVSNREFNRLYFLLADDYTTFCQHENTSIVAKKMDATSILEGLKYARHNFLVPIFVHSNNSFEYNDIKEFEEYKIMHILPIKFFNQSFNLRDCMYVFDKDSIDFHDINYLPKCMLNIDSSDIKNLFLYSSKLFSITDRINVNIPNLNNNFDEIVYREQLILIKDLLIKNFEITGKIKEINLITDLCYLTDHNSCKAGERSFAYAPDGKLYICAAYYGTKKDPISDLFISDLSEHSAYIKNKHLYTIKYNALCSSCDSYQCINCIYINENFTNEVNVSPSFQCRKSYIERQISDLYLKETRYNYKNTIKSVEYLDPINDHISKQTIGTGFYNQLKI